MHTTSFFIDDHSEFTSDENVTVSEECLRSGSEIARLVAEAKRRKEALRTSSRETSDASV